MLSVISEKLGAHMHDKYLLFSCDHLPPFLRDLHGPITREHKINL